MLDIGDVLADKGRGKRYLYDAFAPEAFPFLCLAVAKVGADNIYINSRTKQGISKRATCWAYRWLSNIGLFRVLRVPESHLQFCTGYEGRSGKGPRALEWGITHVVDDMQAHLSSCAHYARDSLATDGLILFGDGPLASSSVPIVRVRNFRDLADRLGFGIPHFQAAKELLSPLCIKSSSHPADLKNFSTLFDVLQKRLEDNTLKVATRPGVVGLREAFSNVVKDVAGARQGEASESGTGEQCKRRSASRDADSGRAEPDAKRKICDDVDQKRAEQPSRSAERECAEEKRSSAEQDRPPVSAPASMSRPPGDWESNETPTTPRPPRRVAEPSSAAATPERWPQGGSGCAGANSWAPPPVPASPGMASCGSIHTGINPSGSWLEPLHGWGSTSSSAWAASSVPVWPRSPWGQVPPPTHVCAAATVPPAPPSRGAGSSSSSARLSSSYCGKNWSPKPDGWYSRSRKERDEVPAEEPGGRNCKRGEHTGANYHRKQKKTKRCCKEGSGPQL